MILYGIITFLLVFNFPLPLVKLPSLFVVPIICIIIDFLRYKKLEHYLRLKLTYDLVFLILLFILILSGAVIRTSIAGALDVSYVNHLIKFPVYILISYIYSCHLSKNNISLMDSLIFAFSLQAIIIITSMFSADIKSVFDIFRSVESVESSARYDGVRGLAVSGVIYFGLAITYSVFFLYLSMKNKNRNYRYLFIILIIFFSSFTIARTVLVGVFFSYIALWFFNRKTFSRMQILALGIVFIFSVLISTNQDYFSRIIEQLEFTFEFIYNYYLYGEVRTNSTDVLAVMYYPLSDLQLLLGDGLYMQSDGFHYYGDTDAGYMRNFLFFGLFSLFIYIFNVVFSYMLSRELFLEQSSRIMAFLLLSFLTFIFHYKGDVILMAKPYYTLLFAIYFYHKMENNKELL
ncbi:hypothetical protein OW495_12405 [Vibrio sp. 14N.309.X.WAT.E.F5]|nr:hypothetical protein [Vibrio sp. 14N.309.X.WAT.E.F5]MDN2667523.1 hypothetical protein [Vibrio sp. 14N.309.X.WAT.E.F5]